ncbi:MAG: cache domain-containing protein, partial [Eubacteriales bacterium]|nr:cache domain-containing protein [Eubacteriales bacterium]
MKDQKQSLKDTLRHIGLRTVAAALCIFLITVTMTAYIGNRFYAMEKTVLQQRGELNAKEAAMEYDECLLTRVNIVTVVGYAVDQMLHSGRENRAIEKYLMEETSYIGASLDPSTTGLYGWINGEYLDGAGWVPDADYVAVERPWYTETRSSGGKITFVEPYLDMQTDTIMMTVSTLLSDGESVVAMDVSLDQIQRIVEELSSDSEGSEAFVLDSSGIVVAHSDKTQLGKNYLQESDSLGGAIARRILEDGQRQFDL